MFAEEGLSESATMSVPFAVGFFLAMRSIFTALLVRYLGTEPQTAAAIHLVLGFLVLGFVWFYSFGSGGLKLRNLIELPSIRWAFLFLAFSCCSLMWSESVSLAASFAYWCGTAMDVATIFLIFRAKSSLQVAESVMKGFICGACFIALIVWMLPGQSDMRLGDEDYFNTNSIGNLCAFAILLAEYLIRRKVGKWGFATSVLAVTLLRSLSKTTIVAFLVSQVFLLIQDRSMSRRSKVWLTTAAILTIFVFWGMLEAYFTAYTASGNTAETLTGRTGIWAYVFINALDKPWIGHGFDSMWKVVPSFGLFEPRHAENELLEQFYCYGAAGLCILSGVYGSLYLRFRKLSAGPTRIVLTSTLIYFVIRGLAEADPFDLLLPLWVVILLSVLAEKLQPASAKTQNVSSTVRALDLNVSQIVTPL